MLTWCWEHSDCVRLQPRSQTLPSEFLSFLLRAKYSITYLDSLVATVMWCSYFVDHDVEVTCMLSLFYGFRFSQDPARYRQAPFFLEGAKILMYSVPNFQKILTGAATMTDGLSNMSTSLNLRQRDAWAFSRYRPFYRKSISIQSWWVYLLAVKTYCLKVRMSASSSAVLQFVMYRLTK